MVEGREKENKGMKEERGGTEALRVTKIHLARKKEGSFTRDGRKFRWVREKKEEGGRRNFPPLPCMRTCGCA